MAEYEWFTDPLTNRQTFRRVRKASEQVAVPHFVGDEMPPTIAPWNPSGKEVYTSKRAWRKAQARNGYVEVGDAFEREGLEITQPRGQLERESVETTLRRHFERVGLL